MSNQPVPATLLQQFFERSPDLLFIAGADGKLLHCSDRFGRELGPAVEGGAPFLSLVRAEDRAGVSAAWARAERGEEDVSFTARIKDQRRGDRSMTCHLVKSADGATLCGTLRDAPDAAPSGVMALKARILDAFADHLPVCIWAADRDGKCVYSDGAGLEKLGVKRGQLLHTNLFEVYTDEASVTWLRRAIAGQPVHETFRGLGIDWETWMIPTGDTQSGGAAVLGFTLDVSKTKEVEEELRVKLDQIQKQQEVIRNLSTPIIEVWEGVLTLPMVGVVDSVRTADVMDSLLARIVDKQARFAILDLTGVEIVDTKVANHLIELITAIGLLGAEGIVAGIKPNVAQTMVALGLDLSQISTHRNLRAALGHCIRRASAAAGASPR